MADVTARSGRRDSARGQLLLLGGIVLAMIFIGIALVLNGSIFAENLATRQSGGASADIQEFRSTVADGVGDAIGSTNQDGAGESFDTLRDSRYQPRVETLADQLANRRSLDGEAIQLTTDGSRPGTQVVDADASTDFTPRDATTTTGDWTMVASAHVRAFELTADPTASDSTSEVTTQLTGGTGDAFEVTLTAATGTAHEVAVYEDSDDSTVRVAVSEVGSGAVRECDAEGGAATVSLTGRPTVDGAYCDALGPVAETSGTYEVNVTNGDLALGTYRLVVDRLDGPSASEESLDEQVDHVNYGAACSGTTYADTVGDDPYSVPAIYAGTVDLRYRSHQATTDATVQVMPEQAGDSLDTPLVASLDVTDNSATDGDASFTVDWTVEDPNGDLSKVTLELVDGGTVVDTAEDTSIGGESAGGLLSVSETDGGGNTYDLAVTVTDGMAERTRTVTHDADGDTDTSGACPL
ncbi:DUF7261 family protein [Haloglomus halophilum]|uniref:DUF7261 family protein n=1 Tax=Haloglomus halophilum TaxID=2962672 RepID=UPI0020C9A727|nr:hypothetical protein [Haloglomus halophilum]